MLDHTSDTKASQEECAEYGDDHLSLERYPGPWMISSVLLEPVPDDQDPERGDQESEDTHQTGKS